MEHLPLVENPDARRVAVARKDRLIKLVLGGALVITLVALVAVSVVLGTQINRLSEKPTSSEHDRSDDFPLRIPDAWDITKNHDRKLTFTTSEGTWLNVDVSPDGKTILFDMLGDLYTMPITGGRATAIRAGVSFDTQPRFSPSGQLILFTSDQGGCDNIWVMNAATREAWPVTTEPYHFVSNAWWSSESTILAVKWYTSERSLGGGEIWSYEIGSASQNGAPGYSARGTRLVGRSGFGVQVGPEEPVAGSDDGKTLFYSKNTADSTVFQYSKDPHSGIYSIFKHDIATGAEAAIASGPGGAARPVLNRARTLLAFIRRTKWKTSLMLKDLKNSNEKILWDGLDFDQQESYAPSGVYPSFAFTPDDAAVIVWSKGQIWRVEVATGLAQLIPFTADVSLDLAETLRFTQQVSSNDSTDGSFATKVAVSPVADGSSQRIIFEALGGIWSLDMTNDAAEPQIVVDFDDNVLQSNPALTTSGDWFSYIEWSDQTLAQMYIAKTANPTQRWPIPENYPGRFSRIVFSPKSDKVAYIRLGGDSQSGSLFSSGAGVYWRSVNLAGAEPVWGASVGPISGRHATFSSNGDYVFVVEGEYPKTHLWRYTEATPSQRTLIASSIYATDIRISPDQKYIAFIEFRKVYIAPFTMGNAKSATGPFNATAMNAGAQAGVKLVYSRGADYLSWSADGSKLRWGWAAEFFEIDAAKFLASSSPSTSKISSWDLSIDTKAAIAPTFVVFDNATIVTMDSDLGVITNGRIIVKNGLIQNVGEAAQIDIPAQAEVVDVQGGYILPGFIDAHAHWLGAWGAEYKVKNSWEFLVNLAFGVTTLHNPSADTASIFRDAELIKVGAKVGPRLASTGTIIYGAGGDIHCDISSYDDAYDFLYQLKQMGAWSVKSYNQPCRAARQRVLAAAKDLKMSVVPEGGMAFWWNLNQIIDGHTTIEHALPMAPLYNDVIKLFSQSGTAWTPTFIVNYGGIFGERYWYQNSKVFDDERLMTYAPEDQVYPQTIRRVAAENVDYHHFVTSQSVKAIFEQGGNVLAGAHGEMQGLGYHWEIRMFSQGNMSNYDVLKAATINPARAHGLDHQIGSIKPGKLADLIFYKAEDSPLDDIWNAAKVRWVMKDGFMWDASRGMAQVLPVAKQAPKLPQLNTPRV